jgi:hypothetical protein
VSADVARGLAWLLAAGFGVTISPVSHRQLSTFQLVLHDAHFDKRGEPPADWRGDDPAVLLAEARAWAQVRGFGP